jgi:hypothetical protein
MKEHELTNLFNSSESGRGNQTWSGYLRLNKDYLVQVCGWCGISDENFECLCFSCYNRKFVLHSHFISWWMFIITILYTFLVLDN